MIRENLVAERIAIDSYREIINYIGTQDSTTRRILELLDADAINWIRADAPDQNLSAGHHRTVAQTQTRYHRQPLRRLDALIFLWTCVSPGRPITITSLNDMAICFRRFSALESNCTPG
jgi:hypothetical protein